MSVSRLNAAAAIVLILLLGAWVARAGPVTEGTTRTAGTVKADTAPESLVATLDYLSDDLGIRHNARPESKFERNFDLDAPPPTTHDLGHGFRFGAKLESEIDLGRNFDLDDSGHDHETSIEPEFSLAFSYDPVSYLSAFLELAAARDYLDEDPGDSDWEGTNLFIKRAYLTWRDIVPGLALRVGRQRFDDEREWLYDEDLDAVRLFYSFENFGIEGSISREELFDADVLQRIDEDEVNNFGLTAMLGFGEKSSADAYVFYRNDLSTNPEDLLFLGVRSNGKIASGWKYWLEAAHVRGSKTRRGAKRTISGFGVDLGSTYEFDAPFEPALTLGLAFGTGESDAGDGTDHAFRQSGLQGNSDKFHGVSSFKYYGETLDPELSNMIIATLGAGVRPTERTSIDLVYHRYWQYRRSDDLRDVAINADPNGGSRDLGHGLDIVLGFRELENFDASLVAGTFIPGSAFDSGSDPAYFLGLEFQLKF